MVEAGDICCLSGIDDVLVLLPAEPSLLLTGRLGQHSGYPCLITSPDVLSHHSLAFFYLENRLGLVFDSNTNSCHPIILVSSLNV